MSQRQLKGQMHLRAEAELLRRQMEMVPLGAIRDGLLLEAQSIESAAATESCIESSELRPSNDHDD